MRLLIDTDIILYTCTHTHTHTAGVGKTTIVQRVCSQLQEKHSDIELRGFSIEQVRQEYSWAGNRYLGPKIGFDVVTMDRRRGKLARIDMYAPSFVNLIFQEVYSVWLKIS